MKIGGGGIGRTAWHQIRPLQKADMIEAVYAPDRDKRKFKGNFIKVPSVDARYNVQDAYLPR